MGTEIDGVMPEKIEWKVKTWPNLFTFIRLVLGVIAALHIVDMVDMFALQPINFIVRSGFGGDIFIQWSTDYRILVGGFVLTIAIAADGIDGYLARKCGWCSPFGEVFDPFVDKILFWAGYVSIVVVQQIMSMQLFLLCTSPLLLLGLVYDVWSIRQHILNRGGAVGSGKIKSFLLYCALLACFVSIALCDMWPQYKDNAGIFYGGFIIGAVLIVTSVHMFYNSWDQRR